MKKYIAILVVAAIVFAVSGCPKEPDQTNEQSGNPQLETKETREDAGGLQQQEGDSASGDWNTSGLSREQIDSIDWNLDAYTKYFRVDSEGATFHYWELETCLAILPEGDVIYMNEDGTIVVDAESGDVYRSESAFFAGMIPPADSGEMDIPLIPLAPTGDYDFTFSKDAEAGMYVFAVDLGESHNEYYVNEDLVCIGWQVTTEDGSVSYYLGEDPGFENVADQVLPGGASSLDIP